MHDTWPWLTLALLGAYHGINPGMGWLFAVALGLQERSRAAVIRAFAPIALGHAISIGCVVALVAVARTTVAPSAVGIVAAALLILFGLYKLLAPMSHPRWVGMVVGFRDLTVWSFLMATAHGAGLMVVPVLLKLPAAGPPTGHEHHLHHIAATSGTVGPLAGLAAVIVHTAAMFVVMAAVALLVYEKLGLAMLRRTWFNVDRLWAIALILAGIAAFLLR